MLLIKNAIIVEPGSKLNGKKRNILVKKGRIEAIGARLTEPKAEVIDAAGACLSIGWVDVGVHTGDPGLEHREDLETIAAAATAGGYTGLACWPNTEPAIHAKAQVLYLKNNTSNSLVDFFPIGAVSPNCQGKDLTEMYDMHHAGAVAFSDGEHPIQNSGLMMRALQYVKTFDGLIINCPQDEAIAGNGQMHEGIQSTSMGMKGLPSIAEELMVQRDIYLLEYTDSRLHLANISTAGAVGLIQQAKDRGLALTASVPVLNLALDDRHLDTFESSYKVMPPLRESSDITALKSGLRSGAIDLISSNHTPLEEELKKLEFPYAAFGSIGLETCYALSNTALGDTLDTEALVNILAYNSRKLLRLEVPRIAVGEAACLTLFDPNREWTFSEAHIRSKSKNTPLIGQQFKGKVLAVVNGAQHSIVN
ncbi:MAG: dihydroorotase [Bacteroidota bacterium]